MISLADRPPSRSTHPPTNCTTDQRSSFLLCGHGAILIVDAIRVSMQWDTITELRKSLCTRLREISAWPCLALPGCCLANHTDFFSALYNIIRSRQPRLPKTCHFCLMRRICKIFGEVNKPCPVVKEGCSAAPNPIASQGVGRSVGRSSSFAVVWCGLPLPSLKPITGGKRRAYYRVLLHDPRAAMRFGLYFAHRVARRDTFPGRILPDHSV